MPASKDFQDPLWSRHCSSKDVILFWFGLVWFNIRPRPITCTHHQMRKHTLSLKPSPTKLGSWPSTHAWPMQTNKQGFRVWCLSFRQASTICFHPDLCLRLHSLPRPPRPTPAPANSNPGEAGATGRRGIQNLPSRKTNRNNTNLRGSRFPSLVRDAIPGPRAGPGPGEQVTPGAMAGGRGLALCQEAPEVLTQRLRLPAAAGVARESRAPQPH